MKFWDLETFGLVSSTDVEASAVRYYDSDLLLNQALRRLHFETIVFEVLEQGWYFFQFASVCSFAFTLSIPFKTVILIERRLH